MEWLLLLILVLAAEARAPELLRRRLAAAKGPLPALDNVIGLEMDAGWQPFAFGNASTVAIPQFFFSLYEEGGYVWVTDAFCRGDAYDVYNWEALLGTTGAAVADGCRTNTTSPDAAVQDGSFGHVSFNLSEGDYLLWLQVRDSPFLAGQGFIRLDSEFRTPGQQQQPSTTTSTSSETAIDYQSYLSSLDNGATHTSSTSTTTRPAPTTTRSSTRTPTRTATVSTGPPPVTSAPFGYSIDDPSSSEFDAFERHMCIYTAAGLHVFNLRYSREMAVYFCRKFGWTLASLDSTNLVAALQTVYDCLGRDQRLWIRDYADAPAHRRPPYFQLVSGAARGKGAVWAAAQPADEQYFVCQEKPRKDLRHA